MWKELKKKQTTNKQIKQLLRKKNKDYKATYFSFWEKEKKK